MAPETPNPPRSRPGNLLFRPRHWPVRGRRWFAHSDFVIIILLLGLFIRLVYVANVVTIPWNDMFDYHDVARDVAEGRAFGTHNRFPLFILITSALYRCFGADPILPRLWNVFASVVLMLVIYRLTRALKGPAWVALLALALAAVHPDLVFYCAPVLYEMTMMLLIALTLYLAISNAPPGLTGAALALTVLAKPTNIILLPLVLARREMRTQWKKRLLPFLAAFLILMLPWWIRNYLVFDGSLLSGPGAGMMFYLGNHPGQENETFIEPKIIPAMRYYPELKAIYDRYREHKPDRHMFVLPEAEKYFVREALNCIRTHPGAALAEYARRLLTFYSGRHCWFLDYYYSYNLMGSRLPEALMIVLLAFAFYAFVTGRGEEGLRFVFLTVIAYGLFYALFSLLIRYRLAILPLTIAASAVGIERFGGDLRARRYPRAALLPLLLVLFTLLTVSAV